MPSKSSPLDVLPTWLRMSSIKVFAPVLEHLVNLYFAESCFPLHFNTAQVQPRLKKPGLDREDFANFRQFSNLNTISNVIERLVLTCLGSHLTKSSNFNHVQSPHRSSHSTETTRLQKLSTMCMRISTIVVALDISSAFDTICHSKLLDRLQHDFGIDGFCTSMDHVISAELKSVCKSRLSIIDYDTARRGCPSWLGARSIIIFCLHLTCWRIHPELRSGSP